uniref:SGNH hydrolase-type esterase domain-containing protein n=1 Tax=Sphenodon punctatus TaxID=8508 RepID=A0A8D0GUF0_SPHPU
MKRFSNRSPTCGPPTAKLPKIIGPNPALLEAFKAVVEAGGSGWLDPVAVAAVMPPPPVNELESKSMMPFQPPLRTPISLVMTRSKKPPFRERAAVMTVVPVEGKEPAVANSSNMGPSQSNAPEQPLPKLPFTVPQQLPQSPGKNVADDGGIWPASQKEIWICGHSVVLLLKKRASVHPHGLQLGIAAPRAFVYWHGIQTMLWDQLLPLLHEIYYHRCSPSVIVIHLGENDLVQQASAPLIIKMKNDLGILRRAFPDAYIILSSLLPRRFWKGAKEPANVETARTAVNKEMAKYCLENGIILLRHDLITYDNPSLFLPDVDDLSEAGADVFTADLKGALEFCLHLSEN